jgi:hypothetical protein
MRFFFVGGRNVGMDTQSNGKKTPIKRLGRKGSRLSDPQGTFAAVLIYIGVLKTK